MKKIVLMIMSLLAALGLQAAPISGEKALKIATDFFADGNSVYEKQADIVVGNIGFHLTGQVFFKFTLLIVAIY